MFCRRTAQAEGDLTLHHALGARLSARGRLLVTKSVSTSRLIAGEIQVDGKMHNDSAQAETRIILQDVGSPAGGPCTLRAGYPLESKTEALRRRRAAASLQKKNMRRRAGSLRTRKKPATRPEKARKAELDELCVEDVMTRPAVTVPAEMCVADCIRLMLLTGVRTAPVLSGSELVGMLSFTDVLNAACSRDDE